MIIDEEDIERFRDKVEEKIEIAEEAIEDKVEKLEDYYENSKVDLWRGGKD